MENYLGFYVIDRAPEVADNVWLKALDPAASIRALLAVDDGGNLLGFTHDRFQESLRR